MKLLPFALSSVDEEMMQRFAVNCNGVLTCLEDV